MKQYLLFVSFFCALFQLTYSQASVREQAENEQHSPDLKKVSEKKTTTDVPLSESMLSLQDPRADVVKRSWKYLFNVSVQQFRPQGFTQNDVGTSFNLNNNRTVLMPTAGFGFSSPVEWGAFKINWGAQGLVGYTNQSTSVTFVSGITETDIRLSSILLRAKPTLQVTWSQLSWLTGLLGIEWGYVNYTQSSSNSLANFSKQAPYTGWNIGLGWYATQKLLVTAQYTNRSIQDKNIGLQRDNFEIGTQFLW